MERMGEITQVTGEWLEITFCRPADCEKCNACHGGQKQMQLRLKGEGKVGDIAVVSLPENVLTQASLLAYALPAAGLIGGLMLGDAVLPLPQGLGGIIGGLAGLSLPLVYLVLSEKKRRQNSRWQVQLLRVIPRTSAETEKEE